ncbi:chaplin [Streptomyces sp. FXJ1.172]|uniref:chaplin n=1 Tax=Streptomyces sp. FXJ1.172 TaxID=710705 RepID=UPI0007CF5D7F|nr:chaplin [Streptomyces sp. FXJ1.172]WEO93684.1 chaplin [Streptomyces sp. FXJ1.172]
MRLRSFATTAVLAGVLATGGSATAFAADPNPVGTAANSPGVVSGDVVQVPVDIDANVCGNTINLIGLLNPATGNICANK